MLAVTIMSLHLIILELITGCGLTQLCSTLHKKQPVATRSIGGIQWHRIVTINVSRLILNRFVLVSLRSLSELLMLSITQLLLLRITEAIVLFVIFRPHILGEENHNVCSVFSKICQISSQFGYQPHLHLELLDYFSYLTIVVT